jgi:hypothetical protein
MRIGLITGEYPPLQGGVGAFSRELAAALAQQGHSLHILTDRRAASAGEPGIDVSMTIHNWNRASLFDARRWARTNRLDVVNIQYEAAAFQMVPLVHWMPSLLRLTSPPLPFGVQGRTRSKYALGFLRQGRPHGKAVHSDPNPPP